MAHFYDKDGNCLYEIEMKNGNKRRITIRDAKKLNLVPSVTTVLSSEVPKKMLEIWKQNQIIEACYNNEPQYNLDLNRAIKEHLDDYKKRIRTISEKEGEKAADIGTLIHFWLEEFIKGTVVMSSIENEDLTETLERLKDWIKDNKFNGTSEKIIVGEKYAGTIDFLGETKFAENCMIDFKTQKTTKDKKITFYDDWNYQLNAYNNLLDKPCDHLINVVISSTEPGRIEMREWSSNEKDWGLEEFQFYLRRYYRIKNL